MLAHRVALWCSAAVLVVISPLASATSQRTFVASIGTDNPACSIAAPCRSFAAAITATSSGGEIIVQDSAGYGPATVTKSVSIIAPSGIYAGISVFSGNGVTINAPGATVVLRGLSINGQGGANGILVQAAARVRIENCVVSNMGVVGIYHHADNAEVIVLDTISRDNGDGGFALVAQDASIVLDHVRSEHNVNVGFYMAPTPGSVYAKAITTESAFVNNGGNGIWADTVASARTMAHIDRTTLSNNTSHGFLSTAAASSAYATYTLTRNSIGGNGGDGIHSLGTPPATANVFASANSLHSNKGTGLRVDGSTSYAHVSGNTGVNYNTDMVCKNGATLLSLGDNNVSFIGTDFTCSPTVISGK